MSNGIYIPYFYIIQEISTGMYYAGSKYGKDANPENFMKENGYLTSSANIKTLIEKNGINSFIIRKIKIFTTAEEAHTYETKFLQRVDARKHPKFYNGHNNDFSDNLINLKEIMFQKYGVENASQLDEVKEKKKKTSLKNHGVENPFQMKHIREKVRNNNIEKYGTEYLLCNKEFQLKSKETTMRKYGVSNPYNLQWVRNRRDEAMIEKYGTTCSLQIPEIREKAENTMEVKYGYKYASQIPEIKERKRNNQKEKSSRESVKLIRKYCSKFNLKMGPGWYLKSDEYLEQKINEYTKKYGVL